MPRPRKEENTVAARKNSEARISANNKYNDTAYDRINIAVPKGQNDVIKAHAETRGESVNGFIGRAIVNQIAADNGAQIGAVAAQEWQQAALPPETVEAAQRAAEATGEATQDFICRAVDTQAQRDANALRLGINPSNGDKLDKEV